jgi:hypothetical protein
VQVSYSRPVYEPKPDDNGNLSDSQVEISPEPMTRRQYVLTLSEAEVVDRVLGEQAAKRLYELCVEVEKHG